MEKLISALAPKPEEFIDMPYGLLAYGFFAAAIANIFTGLIAPVDIFTPAFAAFGFRSIAEGRDHMRSKRYLEISHREGMTQDLQNLAVCEYQITTKHMRSNAHICMGITIVMGLREVTLWLSV